MSYETPRLNDSKKWLKSLSAVGLIAGGLLAGSFVLPEKVITIELPSELPSEKNLKLYYGENNFSAGFRVSLFDASGYVVAVNASVIANKQKQCASIGPEWVTQIMSPETNTLIREPHKFVLAVGLDCPGVLQIS